MTGHVSADPSPDVAGPARRRVGGARAVRALNPRRPCARKWSLSTIGFLEEI
jgi:hypothetical protein